MVFKKWFFNAIKKIKVIALVFGHGILSWQFQAGFELLVDTDWLFHFQLASVAAVCDYAPPMRHVGTADYFTALAERKFLNSNSNQFLFYKNIDRLILSIINN